MLGPYDFIFKCIFHFIYFSDFYYNPLFYYIFSFNGRIQISLTASIIHACVHNSLAYL